MNLFNKVTSNIIWFLGAIGVVSNIKDHSYVWAAGSFALAITGLISIIKEKQ